MLALTREQARALETVLDSSDHEVRVFIAMRYWHPTSDEAAAAVAQFGPDEIILLPLYPQYSTTTTGSSFGDWRTAAARHGIAVPSTAIGCYPIAEGLIAAQAGLIEGCLAKLARDQPGRPVRVLFSAHGLPKKIVDDGDPYQWQVERTVSAVCAVLGRDGLDFAVCYQSKVGRLEWLGPSTEAEITRAGKDGVALVVVPIAFVSEHSETLVELDIEYREHARRAGVVGYERAPALGTDPAFIAALASLVEAARGGGGVRCGAGARLCPDSLSRCVCSGGAS